MVPGPPHQRLRAAHNPESEDPGSVEGVVPGALRERDMSIDEATTEQRSRRAILVGAIGGLAGLVGSRIAWPDEADAAAGGHMLLGRANSAGTKNTSLVTKTTGHALKVTQKGAGTALRGTNTLGTAISGATGNAAKFGVDASNTAATPGAGAAMHAVGGVNPGLIATSTGIAVNGTSTGSNFGVSGTGVYGGVTGTGGSFGLYGSSANYSLYGVGGLYGAVGLGTATGVYGGGPTGLYGTGDTFGVYGNTANSSSDAIRGEGGGNAVHGLNGATTGVRGDSGYVGVWGQGAAWGLYGRATASTGFTYGVMGAASSPSGYAMYAQGNMHVSGTLSKAAGSFMIDHPLDPENRWLSHSFVESPDMMNVYNGTTELDDAGKAAIKLPAYFEALNRDFRYQLTAVGGPAPDLHVSREIDKNAFAIAGGTAGQKVSWQVTGIRQDDYAKAHPIKVETDKGASERGMRQFVPKGSKARLMTVGPAGAHDKQPASPHLVPETVTPRDH